MSKSGKRRGKFGVLTGHTTLRVRFTLVIVAVILGVAATLDAYFLRQMNQDADRELRARAVSLATNLAYNAEYGAYVANSTMLRRSAEGLAREPDVEYVRIEDRHGQTLTDLGDFESESAPEPLSPTAMSDYDAARLVEYVNLGGVHILEASVPILLRPDSAMEEDPFLSGNSRSSGPQWIGSVRVGISREPSFLRLARLQRTVILITLFISVLGVAIAVLFVRRIVGPIKSLLHGTQRIAQGDLLHRVNIEDCDEVGELADSFNSMTSDLLRARTELEAYSISLESKVKERTRKLEDAQSRLLQSEKLSAIGKLVAGVAHELNNPLTGILGYAQLLQRQSSGGENAKALERICNEALRSKRIVQNLLTFARRQRTAKTPTDINKILERTLELRSYQMSLDNIEVVIDLQPHLPLLQADFHQLQQVFLNIIINSHQAMKGSKKKGRLTVRSQKREGHVCVDIEDNGPGIPASLRERIFDPFFTTKEVGGGTGLGLSICYGIVEEHGGRIAVESETGTGVGAHFTIELPFASEPPEAEARDKGEKAGPATAAASGALAVGEALRVLIVDDEPSVLDVLVQALNQEGFVVEQAQNGSEALKLIVKHKPDLIISDMRMPVMDGKELYERVGALDPALAGRMLFITGDTVSKDSRSFLERCGNCCLEKPFELSELIVLLRESAAQIRRTRVLVR